MKLFLSSIIIAALVATWVSAEPYKVDPVHSTIVFRIGHLGISHVNGRFNGPTGTVDYDPANPEKASFDVQVEAENIDTDNQSRDKDLRSDHFFDVEKYQTISFKSTSVKKLDDKTLEVNGNMTLHGVTKPISVTLTYQGTATDPKGATRAGFGTSFSVKRSDYGMSHMIPAVGDEAKLTVDLECVKQGVSQSQSQ